MQAAERRVQPERERVLRVWNDGDSSRLKHCTTNDACATGGATLPSGGSMLLR